MSRTEWLDERRKSMGASDIAAAATGRYGGATKAVASKLSDAHDDDIDPALADRGNRWEHAIADGVLAHHRLYVHGEQMLVRNPATPHIHTTVDGMLHPEPAGISLDDIAADGANLEIKTRGPHAPWPRDYYRAQAQVGMHCTGAARCLLVIATVDTDYDTTTGQMVDRLLSVHYEWVDRDQAEIDRLVALATDLWAHVERGELPEPTGPEALPYVKAHNIASDPATTADIDDLADLIARREALRASLKAAEDEAATIEAKIRHRMGEATEAVAAGRWRVRIGVAIRKFTSRSEADFLDLYADRAAELGLTRTVLDRDKAKAEMPEEYDALRIATPDRRLTVKNLQEDQTT